MCVCVRERERHEQNGSARVTPENEKMTRKGGNMKGKRKKAQREKRNKRKKHRMSQKVKLIKSPGKTE